jgi:hypothetical protein
MAKAYLAFLLLFPFLMTAPASARMVGTPSASELIVTEGSIARAPVVVAADAGPWEKKAAADLSKYVGLMSGATVPVVNVAPASGPAIIVGRAAIAADRGMAAALKRAGKAHPVVQSDVVAVRRVGQRLYIAGSNDESQYFAASWLLQQWGCRWYMPTAFGEVVPEHSRLSVGALDFVYAPPFEIRRYWIAWNGDATGAEDFQRRNFMSGATMPGYGHALDQYTADIAPPGGTHFNVPFAAPRTAEHVAAKVDADYAAGKDISLAIADGDYANLDPADKALGGDYDPYMLAPSLSDAMMVLYNNVGRILRRRHPHSRALIGGMAYSNVTRPPRHILTAPSNLVMWIAPIDIDPNHAMDDPRSPPKLEYRDMVARWSKVMGGRLAIYDYDQGMMVWRDIPNPSQQVFARDAKIYRDLNILGIQTESRGALSTTFLNLFFRGQLMWNPDADVQALLREFYPGFYGPAAAPMERYWRRIFAAWDQTAVTEHEYPIIPAIYTPAMVEALRVDLEGAEAALRAPHTAGRNDARYAERLRFTRQTFDMLAAYGATVTAAASEADYAAAVAAGKQALEAQRALRVMNPLFVSGIVGGEDGVSWLAGEVGQYAALQALTDGSKGRQVTRLSRDWQFKVETPLPAAWRHAGPEGAASGNPRLATEETNSASGWRSVRSDLYLQAQGILAPDGQSPLGHYWYRTTVDAGAPDTAGKLHLMFPGLFNEAWLYVNGKPVAHRSYKEPWWRTDYRFEWDVDISGVLHAGHNDIAVRGFNPHHFGGMFRRPFLYRPN